MHSDDITDAQVGMRGALVPSWLSRISWGGVVSGMVITITSAVILVLAGLLIGFGAIFESSLTEVRDTGPSIGIWIIFTALASSFLGSYIAARLANVRFTEDGLWHGVIVWATVLALGTLLSAFVISFLLGIYAISLVIAGGVPFVNLGIPAADAQAILDLIFLSIEFVLLSSLLSLTTALLGGWAGSGRVRREEMLEREERYHERKVA